MGWPVKAFPRILLTAALVCFTSSYALAARHSDRQDQKAKADQKSEHELYKELSPQYKRWLDEDVVYIITPEERRAFLHLQTNEEREQFIEAFWQRRNPDPDSPENTYKEEYYRRIAYANEHFASGIPGWKTDRGKIYIMWGPPDEIDSHPTGGTWDRPMDQGGGETTTYPYEDWTYRYLEGIGENVQLEFVDPTGTGEYHLTMDPSEKDALLNVPGAGLTMAESMGMASKDQRFSDTDGTHMAEGEFGGMPLNTDDEEFNRLEQYADIMKPPPVKFKDLEAIVTQHMIRNQLNFAYHYDFLRITSDTVLVPITVQIPVKQLTFQQKDGVDTASMHLFARITSLTGRVVQTFEDTLRADYAADQLQNAIGTARIYQKAVPLAPGLYELDIVVKDVNSGNVGVVNTRLPVPLFRDDQLSASSLILADDIEPVSMKDIGVGQFVLGDVKVQPQLNHTFLQNQSMGIFLQVYNLKVDQKTDRANTTVEFRVVKDNATVPALKFDLPASQLPEHGEELTLEKKMTLGSLTPGNYKLEIAVTDNLAKQTITPTANFTIRSLPASATQGR